MPAPVVSAPITLPHPSPPPPVPIAAPAVLATLDRTDLLALAAKAADAYASNVAMPAEIGAATGRRFDLVLPFGCEAAGAMESPGTMRWRFDAKTATLRVTVDPTTWRSDEWSGADATDGDAGLRGFWIARPWSTATGCAGLRQPSAEVGSAPVLLPGQTVAIARLIDAGDVAKARPYEVVQRSAAGDFDPEQGFQLRITGRVQSLSGAAPVKCVQPGGGEQRPLCVITASFAEASIENPKSGAVLANWPIGGDFRGSEAAGRYNGAAGRR